MNYNFYGIIKYLVPNFLKNLIKKKRYYNAIDNIDHKLNKYINHRNGFFIECGANDGVNQSNTWFFEKKLNWRGILIEPVPKLFTQLKNNRCKKNIFENVCLVGKNYRSQYINMRYDNCQTKVFGDNKNKKIKAKTSTLSELLDKNKIIKSIDLFTLDVEGYEDNVLDGINFSKHNFKFFLIETKKFFKIKKYLNSRNYQFIKKLSRHDYLFKYIPKKYEKDINLIHIKK
jgi:FkbM family methyltransferase